MFKPEVYLIITLTPRANPPTPRAHPTAPRTTGDLHMTEQPNPTTGRPLTPTQASRLEFARQDPARATELAGLSKASLILTVERLRGRLDDMIHLVDEITQATPDNHQ